MDCQFNIGDYVETKDGKVGYIKNIEDDWAETSCASWIFNIKLVNNYSILSKMFKRVGKYDFSKQNKIEPLSNMGFIDYRNNLVDCKMNMQNVLDMWDKINEIIEYINNEK